MGPAPFRTKSVPLVFFTFGDTKFTKRPPPGWHAVVGPVIRTRPARCLGAEICKNSDFCIFENFLNCNDFSKKKKKITFSRNETRTPNGRISASLCPLVPRLCGIDAARRAALFFGKIGAARQRSPLGRLSRVRGARRAPRRRCVPLAAGGCVIFCATQLAPSVTNQGRSMPVGDKPGEVNASR